MIIPKATNKRALCIIDVQPKSLNGDTSKDIVRKISHFIDIVPYDAYIVVEFYSPQGSSLYKQTFDLLSKENAGTTDSKILSKMKNKSNVCYIEKTDRSCFALENQSKILEFLDQHKIQEIHFVGFDIDDCVLASLYGSFACGFYGYVLEELSHHHAGNQKLYESALNIFRHHHLTNNSIHPSIPSEEFDLSL